MIRVHPIPSTDPAFHELVRFALNAAGSTTRDELTASDEAMLERALAVIRRECPDVELRKQHQLAAVRPGEAVWYVYRDATTVG